jgi:hypothetical protein
MLSPGDEITQPPNGGSPGKCGKAVIPSSISQITHGQQFINIASVSLKDVLFTQLLMS